MATPTGPKYTIKVFNYSHGSAVPPSDSVGVKLIDQRFNIDYQYSAVLDSDYPTKLPVLMAGGDEPDLFGILGEPDSNFFKWAQEGALLPLNDYLKGTAIMQQVPQRLWDVFSLNGKIYGIPQYYPSYILSPILRQDWLEKLKMPVPTSYDEYQAVVLAMTKNDPDGNGKNDTYGLAMGQNIDPDYEMGAYWSTSWYKYPGSNDYIPGWVGPGRQALITWLAALFKQGAVTPDFAALNWPDTNKEFYSGKAGGFIGAPRGMSEAYMQGLLAIDPKATFAPVHSFKAPDGTTGFTQSSGFYGADALSSKLKSDPGKIGRILDVLASQRQFFPPEQHNPSNPAFDWANGFNGKGYDMVNGKAVTKPGDLNQAALRPNTFYIDSPWAPSDAANEYPKGYQVPVLQKLTAELETVQKEGTPYYDVGLGAYSPTQAAKGTQLSKFLIDNQTKMIAGQQPLSSWDTMVSQWKAQGGDAIIKEVNAAIQARKG